MTRSETSSLFVALLSVTLGSCIRGNDTKQCNNGTLLLHIRCEATLMDADAVNLLVKRRGEQGTPFTTKLTCPGDRFYEVKIPDYQSGQVFDVDAQAMSGAAPLGAGRQLADIMLPESCALALLNLDSGTEGLDGGLDASGPKEDASESRGAIANGAACSVASECRSGFCADGVCCKSACKGACESCALVGSPGLCKVTPDGQLPEAGKTCAARPQDTCGQDGLCNGKGACRNWPDGTTCAPGMCDASGSRGRKVCSKGLCEGQKNLVCAPYLCDAKNTSCF